MLAGRKATYDVGRARQRKGSNILIPEATPEPMTIDRAVQIIDNCLCVNGSLQQEKPTRREVARALGDDKLLVIEEEDGKTKVFLLNDDPAMSYLCQNF